MRYCRVLLLSILVAMLALSAICAVATPQDKPVQSPHKAVMPSHKSVKSPQKPLQVAWEFRIKNKNDGVQPQGKVYLNVSGHKIMIVRKAHFDYFVLSRDDYASGKVPASALVACTGWWAGYGENMYVIRKGNTLKVYRRDIEEQVPDGKYHLLKSVPIP